MEYRRNRQRGGSYFFTVVTHSRRPILIEHIDRLREAFRHTRRRYPFEIDAIAGRLNTTPLAYIIAI